MFVTPSFWLADGCATIRVRSANRWYLTRTWSWRIFYQSRTQNIGYCFKMCWKKILQSATSCNWRILKIYSLTAKYKNKHFKYFIFDIFSFVLFSKRSLTVSELRYAQANNRNWIVIKLKLQLLCNALILFIHGTRFNVIWPCTRFTAHRGIGLKMGRDKWDNSNRTTAVHTAVL